jgi:hypothetical protein
MGAQPSRELGCRSSHQKESEVVGNTTHPISDFRDFQHQLSARSALALMPSITVLCRQKTIRKKLKKLQIEALINDSKSKRSYTQIRTTG